MEGGAQQNVVSNTTITNTTYAPPPGHRYTFIVTATDNAGNWATAQTTTTLKSVRKYYLFGGKRVAMRADNVIYYLHGDHLGSTSLVTDGAGNVVARQLYLPYGAPRWISGTLPTDFTFTGQRADTTGLMYYRARYYSSYLNRWIQPDTIVPQPGNPQDLNRFSYTRNNPLRYTDPTGHCLNDGSDPDCMAVYNGIIATLGGQFNVADLWKWDKARLQGLEGWVNRGVRFVGNWHADNVGIVMDALNATQTSLGGSTDAALGLNHGTLTYRRGIDDAQLGPNVAGAAVFDGKNQIAFSSGDLGLALVLHETGHQVDWHVGNEKGFWSDKNFISAQYTRDRFLGFLWEVGDRKYRGNIGDAPNSTSGSPEDFADTFAWHVMASPGNAGIGALGGGWRPASADRQRDLNTALNSLTVQARP